jgi:hypothetical protein
MIGLMIIAAPAIALQPGDANLDNVVDMEDFTALANNLGASPRAWGDGDFNSDANVNLEDFSILKANFQLSGSQLGASPLGESPDPSLVLLIDEATDQAWLKNTSAAPLEMAGYQIKSVDGLLDPAGWVSIVDAALTRPDDVLAQLGAGAFDFREGMTGLTESLGEVNLTKFALFQPGASWPIGKPAPAASLTDLTFRYVLDDDTVQDGGIELVPEPATISFLAIGGLALLRRRANRRFQASGLRRERRPAR